MLTLIQWRRPLVLVFGLFLCATPPVRGGGKSDKIDFPTVDGVNISGSFYASNNGKKAPCVILLHDFDPRTGGDSRGQGFDDLAGKLQEKGYAVLSFDFRGHGQSTSVTPTFWMMRNNMQFRGAALPVAMRPKTISYKQFPQGYTQYLVNDIAAAQAYLDERNDAGDCNSRNVVVIGAGQGANIGLMWMASEFKRYKATVNMIGLQPIVQKLDTDPAGRNFMAAVWLNLPGPTTYIQGVSVARLLGEVGKTNKVPMGFLYGAEDEKADKLALGYVKDINPSYVRGGAIKDKDFDRTADHGIKGTKLSGGKLLQEGLGTDDLIVGYLSKVEEKHRSLPWKLHNNEDAWYYWKLAFGQPILAKQKGEKTPVILPASILVGR